MAELDLLVKSVRLRGSSDVVNIGVTGGRIAFIDPGRTGSATTTVEAKGNLALPPFVDTHMHLDKAFIGGWTAPTSGLYAEAERKVKDYKRSVTVEDVRRRAGRAIEAAVRNGMAHVRTNVDLDTIGGLTGFQGLLEARKDYADVIDIEIAAMPHDGLIVDDGCEKLVWQAMEMGADVVGGAPRQELDDDDSRRHIDKVFEIAKHFGKPIDMHIDATCDFHLRTIHYLAAKTIREGYQGRVTAGHVVALSYYNEYYAERIIRLIKRAGLHIVTCPATTMISAPILDKEPRGRGITRVRQLLEAGVNVAIGQDNIDDPYNPFGDADPMTNGFLTAYAAQLSSDADLEALLDMLTTNGGRILGRHTLDVVPGGPATFNIVNAPTIREMFRVRAERLYVIREGRIIATTTVERRLHR